MFRDVSGQYHLDKANPANSRFQLVIRADSLDTNNAERDKHLRSADFFDVQQFPDIMFDSIAANSSTRRKAARSSGSSARSRSTACRGKSSSTCGCSAKEPH